MRVSLIKLFSAVLLILVLITTASGQITLNMDGSSGVSFTPDQVDVKFSIEGSSESLKIANLEADTRESAPFTLSMDGSSEISFTPNKVDISFKIKGYSEDIKTARLEAKTRVAGVISAIQDFGVKPGHISAGHMTVQTHYEEPDKREKIVGYTVIRNMTVTITDLRNYDDVVEVVYDSGAESIDNVSFKSTELQKYRKEALTLATRAAMDKIKTMLAEIGCKPGAPLDVKINHVRMSDNRNISSYSASNMAASFGDNTYSGSYSMAPGQFTVVASVEVLFTVEFAGYAG